MVLITVLKNSSSSPEGPFTKAIRKDKPINRDLLNTLKILSI